MKITPEHALWILAESEVKHRRMVAVASSFSVPFLGAKIREAEEFAAALQLARDAIRREMGRAAECDCLYCITTRDALGDYHGGRDAKDDR